MSEPLPNDHPRERPLNRRSFLKRSAAAGLVLTLADPCASAGASSDAHDVSLTLQLFLDDVLVQQSKGLTRILHQPQKTGPIQEADGSPWQRGDQHSVVRDISGRFHMTYRFYWEDPGVRSLSPSIGEDRAHWFRETTGYATSDDGIRWTKPVLNLVDGPTGFRRTPESKWKDGVFLEPTGFSRRNNLGCPIQVIQDLGSFGNVPDPRRRYLVNVLRKSDTHPFAEMTDAGLYFAADVPDLLGDPNWRKHMDVIWEGKRRGPRGPAVRVAGFDDREKLWVELTQCTFGNIVRLGGRSISRWTSRDLIDWSPEELVLHIAPDESRKPDDWIEYMDIRAFRVADLWLGQLVIFHGDRTSDQYEMPTRRGVWRKGTTEVRLITSRDAGKTWTRVGDKTVWLPHHPDDAGYDRLTFAGSPVKVGDELWLYYNCWDGDHLVWNRDGTTYYKNRARISRTARAVLRWNGFMSLRADASSGDLITKPLTTTGRRLTLNAAASSGTIRVELQDLEGHPIPNYTLAECVPLTADSLSLPASWGNTPDLPPTLQNQPLRLRFQLQSADLYGFQFTT